MKYLQWNNVIGEYFFNPSNEGEEVLLYVTKKEISELGVNKFGFLSDSESWDDYCKSIKCEFPETSSRGSFIDKFIVVSDKWKKYERFVFELNNKDDLNIDNISIYANYSADLKIVYPFYLGYIVALIIPLTDNVNSYRANAFFPPLNDFLICNNIATAKNRTGSIAEIDWIWSNLEKWSTVYYKTDLGFFSERHLGNPNWHYVGKPFSQCLLSPRNIRDIPNIFWAADIAPLSAVTDSHFLRIINLYGEAKAGFNKRIKSIINDEDNSLRKVIVDIVKREYVNWKGDVIEYDEDETIKRPKSGWIYGTLLSAFTLNREDETLNHFYYLFSKNDFPEELNLGGNEIRNSGNGYSKPIPIPFNQNLNLIDEQSKWKAGATQSDIVIYSSGSYHGLPSNNFIETDKISRQSTMFLLCADFKNPIIKEWGNTFLQGDFNLVNYVNIPKGFSLYKFKNPQQSHPTEELLKVTTIKRMELRGGIKVGNRDYLKNLLPIIYVDGAEGTEKLFLEYKNPDNKIYLTKNTEIPEEFTIPADVICNQIFLIRDENEKLDNSEIPYQIVDFDFNALDIINENLTKRNKFGEISGLDETSYVIGSNTTYSDWQMQSSYLYDFFSSSYTNVEFIPNEIDYKLQNGNLILQILSIKRNLKMDEFSEILDSIESNSRIWEHSKIQLIPKYVKQTSIRFYDYLGFLDYEYSPNASKISINKPQFVIIPSNSSKAILIGGRSKSFVDNLQKSCNKHQINFEIIPQASQLNIYYLPDLIRLTPANCKNSTEAWKKLQTVATELNIEFRINDRPYPQPQIVQFGLQDFSETIKGYKQNILVNNFEEKPNYEWARKIFYINDFKFHKDDNPIDKNLSLQEYNVQNKYSYILWLDNKSYKVDRNWGKFLLLSEKNKNVIYYNEERQELALPKDVLLPRLIAESIMLLSGQAPYYKKIVIEDKILIYQFYQNVPKIFAENLFGKFNQQIQIKNDL